MLNGPLKAFPRGYAHSPAGPFHALRTIGGLERLGLVTVSSGYVKLNPRSIDLQRWVESQQSTASRQSTDSLQSTESIAK